MNLYLDDDIVKGSLVARLKKAGHAIVLPAMVGQARASDPSHLLYALEHNLVVLTKNHDDFKVLHLLVQAVKGQHPGILVVRAHNDPKRDMKDKDIVRAIRNLEKS